MSNMADQRNNELLWYPNINAGEEKAEYTVANVIQLNLQAQLNLSLTSKTRTAALVHWTSES